MGDVGVYWRTARHLKPIQVFGRLWLHLYSPSPDLDPAPAPRRSTGSWVRPAARSPSLTGEGDFRLLGSERRLDECGWDDPAVDRLWRYNLHYLDDLNADGAWRRAEWHRALVSRWIAENPPAAGTGWEPYPLSLRIVNLIKWVLGGHDPAPELVQSLAVQARWLRKKIEWHLLGNHLFANAKALAYSGLFFTGPDADEWRARAARILRRELPEQVLSDGGHFERSTMYHALALEDVLDLVNVLRAFAPDCDDARLSGLGELLEEGARRMLAFYRAMCHPDAEISLFNDAAPGIAPSSVELERYAGALGIEAQWPSGESVMDFPASGYVRVARGPATAILDLAPVGPDYLPGHAHADSLSFELSLGHRRLIVNGGTSCYGTGPQRLLERSTAWHSTVSVGLHNSSEVWGGFRVGRRARIVERRVDGWQIHGAHDGYCFLPGRPVHRRSWEFGPREVVVRDHLDAPSAPACAWYHLAPGLELEALEPRQSWAVLDGARRVATLRVERGSAEAMVTVRATGFGQLEKANTVRVELVDAQAATRWSWD